jgi:hypothetical protein
MFAPTSCRIEEVLHVIDSWILTNFPTGVLEFDLLSAKCYKKHVLCPLWLGRV